MEECSMTEQEIQKLAADYAALLSEYAALKEEIALMQQQNDWMKKQLFGRKTEQTSVIMEGGTQLSMFSDENEKKPELSEEVVTVAEHKRKKKRTHDDWMSHLPVQEVTHEEEHPVCEKCGSEMKEVEIPIPNISVQREIVNIHRCYIERQRIAAKLKEQLNNLCPILIKGSLQN